MASRDDREPDAGERLADLLARVSTGDNDAWRSIIDLYARRVFALAKSRCGDADLAEEITQSVFATVASTLGAGGYSERGRFEPWLFRITMNRVRDEARRAKRAGVSLESTSATILAAPAPARSLGPAILAMLRQGLAELSDSDREVIELRHHAGLSFKEMTEILNEPLGTLLARHHRALKKLRTILDAAGLTSPLGDDETTDDSKGVGTKP
ncbi:MAG: sigma-70 family RNA polymerase sigma factor [Phycisphaerales bacterium]|nr:sigma-70 family RNA polymerase sigma factor [Phycisphaerales bacterium]